MSFISFEGPEKPRRPALDRAAIVEAAMAVLNAVGLPALSMRLVADRLGVKAASLYGHVRDKEELLILLADSMAASIPDPDPALPWKERALAAARLYRDSLRAIRDGARLLADTVPAGPNRLGKIEAMLVLFRDGGCSPTEAVRAAYHFNNLVIGCAEDEERYRTRADGPAAEMAWKRLAALPPETLPNVRNMMDQFGEGRQDELFDFGIITFLAGLERRLGCF